MQTTCSLLSACICFAFAACGSDTADSPDASSATIDASSGDPADATTTGTPDSMSAPDAAIANCPSNFLPTSIGSVNDLVNVNGGLVLTVVQDSGNALMVNYALALETNTALPLTLPNLNSEVMVFAGYVVDLDVGSVERSYAATAGTIAFETLCATGASGTITDVEFSEIVEVSIIPTLVQDGCDMTYTTIAFDIGSCPQ